MAKITIEIDDKDLWGAVFGAGATQWPWWHSVDYMDGADWETPGTAMIGIEDPDDEDRTIVGAVTVDLLAKAYSKAIQENIIRDRYDDLDANSADIVLQIAILGELVYS
jgi:hypothetical protein